MAFNWVLWNPIDINVIVFTFLAIIATLTENDNVLYPKRNIENKFRKRKQTLYNKNKNKNKNKNSLLFKYIEIHWKLLFSAH